MSADEHVRDVYDVVIVGGGLAGTLTARALNRRTPDARVAIVTDDTKDAGSTNPLALCHPVVGGSFRPAPFVIEAYAAARAMYAHSSHANAITLVRHIPSGPRGERMRKSLPFAQAAFPDVDLTLNAARDELRVRPAFAVALRDFVHAERDAVVACGGEIVPGQVLSVEGVRDANTSGRVDVACVDARPLRAAQVVIAAGSRLGMLWSSSVEAEGGETVHATFTPTEAATAHTARGAFFVPTGNHVRLGATHVANDAPPRDAHVIGAELTDRLSGVGAFADVSFSDAWVGRRAFFRGDRLPVCGALTDVPNVYTLGALGGTGLLWAPFLAERLSGALAGGPPVPDVFAPSRAIGRGAVTTGRG